MSRINTPGDYYQGRGVLASHGPEAAVLSGRRVPWAAGRLCWCRRGGRGGEGGGVKGAFIRIIFTHSSLFNPLAACFSLPFYVYICLYVCFFQFMLIFFLYLFYYFFLLLVRIYF